MSDRDDPRHISNLSNEQLMNLYKTLISMKDTNEKYAGALNKAQDSVIEGPFGVQLHINDGRWKPDLTPVDKALEQVAIELLEREIFDEDD